VGHRTECINFCVPHANVWFGGESAQDVREAEMNISICDLYFDLKVFSLLLSALALVLSWRQNVRVSIIFMAFAVAFQSGIAFTPTCATIIDMRKMPIIGDGPR
jgi:hypothetical protein